MIAKNHSEKTINEPWIRHDLKYTQSHGRNQPIKGNSYNQHTHRPHGTRQTTAGKEPRRPSSPLPDTSKRGRASEKRERQRDERDERRDADVEASTSRQTHGRSPRMRRHRHGHDDITEQASRENGLIIPPRLTTRVERGARRGEAKRKSQEIETEAGARRSSPPAPF